MKNISAGRTITLRVFFASGVTAVLGLFLSNCQRAVDDRPIAAGPAASPTASGRPPGTAAPAAAPEAVPAREEGFQPLALADFDGILAEPGTWREEHGLLICTGKPKGYIHSRVSYGNFTWRLEYRFARPEGIVDETQLGAANSGFMVHIHEPHKVWPRSLEVQGKHVEMCSIKSNGGVPELVIHDDPQARATARKPVGEWNRVEIVSQDGALTSFLNGTRICTSEPGELTDGYIGLQSENYAVEFRNVRIRVDK